VAGGWASWPALPAVGEQYGGSGATSRANAVVIEELAYSGFAFRD